MLERGVPAHEIQRELEGRAGGDLSGSPHRGAGYGLSLGLAAAALALLYGLLRWMRGRRQDNGDEARAQEDDARDSPGPMVTDTALDERLEQELASELADD